MPGTLINFRIPPDLAQEARHVAKERGFSNLQGFVRETLRQELVEYRKERARQGLLALRGIAKGKKLTPLTPADRDRIARELSTKPKSRPRRA